MRRSQTSGTLKHASLTNPTFHEEKINRECIKQSIRCENATAERPQDEDTATCAVEICGPWWPSTSALQRAKSHAMERRAQGRSRAVSFPSPCWRPDRPRQAGERHARQHKDTATRTHCFPPSPPRRIWKVCVCAISCLPSSSGQQTRPRSSFGL